MTMIEKAQTWFWSVALKKVAYAIAKTVISLLISTKIQGILNSQGIQVDIPAITISLPAFIFGILEAGHDWLKLKTDSKWI